MRSHSFWSGNEIVLRRSAISLATNRRRYPEGRARLHESLKSNGFTGDFVSWQPGTFPPGCPEHFEVPFAFKPFCFLEAQKRNLELVLWLDSSCIVIRNLDPIFSTIEEQGYLLFKNRHHVVGEWSSDEALQKLGLSRAQAMIVPEVNAAVIGLNLKHPIAAAFLQKWYEEARDGVAFRGTREKPGTREAYDDLKWNKSKRASADPRVRGHRHDQTVAGVLACRLGMTLTSEGLQSYSQKHRGIGWKTLILIDREVTRKDCARERRSLATLAQIHRDRYLGHLVDLSLNPLRKVESVGGNLLRSVAARQARHRR